MSNKAEIFSKIQALATECHQAACYMELGEERIEMFEVYGVLRNLTRQGYAGQVSRAMNPLLNACENEGDDDDLEDDDDD